MTKRQQNAEWMSSRHHDISFTIKDSDGVAQDITGWTFTYELSKRKGQTALISKSSDVATEISITVAASGTGKVHIVPTDTKPAVGTHLYGKYFHELKSVDGDDVETSEFTGFVTIDRNQVD